MIANVYIDGFNFYYGCVKDTPYRWLDFSKLFALTLQGHKINRIRYFTALVNATRDDPQKRQRQQTYIRALETIPYLTVHFGHFLSNNVRMPLARPPNSGPRTVEVIKTEEKGSDVNLATQLLVDGFRDDYELAVLVTNDSDLVSPIEFVRAELNKKVGILNPHKRVSHALQQSADFNRSIRKGPIRASQFPVTLVDGKGTFHKPKGW